MRELVIVIADLYMPPGAMPEAGAGALSGFEYVGRFGERAALEHGWRAWLADWVGRADLADEPPARIAAATVRTVGTGNGAGSDAPSLWIATPLALEAGLARVHLDHRGILRLPQGELAALAEAFHGVFAASGLTLTPLACGDFLLEAHGISPVPTTEPARFAGGGAQPVLPAGAAAGPLRRLTTEIEMWLHGEALNQARIGRGEDALTTLWLWGGEGTATLAPPRERATHARRANPKLPLAFGTETWLSGLWHLLGAVCRELPDHFDQVLAEVHEEDAVLIVQIAREIRSPQPATLTETLARVDARFVTPALRALRRGELARLTLIANDTRVSVGRGSGLRLWRRPRTALERFA